MKNIKNWLDKKGFIFEEFTLNAELRAEGKEGIFVKIDSLADARQIKKYLNRYDCITDFRCGYTWLQVII